MKLKIDHQKFLNQKGQAIFEMILFLPFLLFLYTIYYSAGNAISGSINQQKAVRGYYYTLVKGNSYIASATDLRGHSGKGIHRVGFGGVGWNERMDREIPIAPCFKFSSLLKNGTSEACDGHIREEQGSSRFIRLFTYYGVCGPTYTAPDSTFIIDPHEQGRSGAASCIMGGN